MLPIHTKELIHHFELCSKSNTTTEQMRLTTAFLETCQTNPLQFLFDLYQILTQPSLPHPIKKAAESNIQQTLLKQSQNPVFIPSAFRLIYSFMSHPSPTLIQKINQVRNLATLITQDPSKAFYRLVNPPLSL